jgi:hypothetical protein
MKKTFIATASSVLMGCSNLNNSAQTAEPTTIKEASSALSVEKEVPPLTRAEVISGISECESAGMRPIVISAKRKVNNQVVPTVVEVTCLPKFK